MSDTPQPWERQPDETAKAYGAFFTYLELGPSRSRDKAYQKATGKLEAQASGHWIKWQREHHWHARATAFDMHELEAKLETRELARERARQVFVDAAEDLAERIVQHARGEFVDREQLKAIQDVLDRAGLGAPKQTNRVELSGPKGGPIQTENADVRELLAQLTDGELEALEAVANRLEPQNLTMR